MTGKVFFSVTVSLDGYIGPESSPDDIDAMHAMRRGESTPSLERWMAQWGKLQSWIFQQRFFRENLNLGAGGYEGRDNAILEKTFQRTGASIMGKRMFDLGEIAWPEEAPIPHARLRPHPRGPRAVAPTWRHDVPLRQRRHPQRPCAGP